MSYSISNAVLSSVSAVSLWPLMLNEVAAKAREFVASLEGVTAAQGSFGTIGAQNLLTSE